MCLQATRLAHFHVRLSTVREGCRVPWHISRSGCLHPLFDCTDLSPPLYLDVWVARSSLVLLTVGNLIIGFSANSASVIAV